jgi:hypothetical protein
LDTKNRYKNPIENVSKVNNKASDRDIINAIIKLARDECEYECVSNLTHSLLCEHKFLDNIGNDSIVNKKLLGGPCEDELRHRYNSAINNRKFFRSYELYEDTHLDRQIKDITKDNHHCDCKDRVSNIPPTINDKKLDKIQADFETYLGEKLYTPNLKTGVQCFEYFKKQGCRIEETKDQITIHFPQDRDFTLPDEIKAMHVLTKERDAQESINFKDHTITIMSKEGN